MSKQYRISGIIGKGAAGTVYLVKDVNGTSNYKSKIRSKHRRYSKEVRALYRLLVLSNIYEIFQEN